MNNDSTPVATPHVEIFTVGGCEPNPGLGGYGAVLLHPKKRAEVSGGFRLTTNNRMKILSMSRVVTRVFRPCESKLTGETPVRLLPRSLVQEFKARKVFRRNFSPTEAERVSACVCRSKRSSGLSRGPRILRWLD